MIEKQRIDYITKGTFFTKQKPISGESEMIFVRLGREKKTLLYGNLEIPNDRSISKSSNISKNSNRSGFYTFFDEQDEIQTTDKITFSKFQTGMDCNDNVDNYR